MGLRHGDFWVAALSSCSSTKQESEAQLSLSVLGQVPPLVQERRFELACLLTNSGGQPADVCVRRGISVGVVTPGVGRTWPAYSSGWTTDGGCSDSFRLGAGESRRLAREFTVPVSIPAGEGALVVDMSIRVGPKGRDSTIEMPRVAVMVVSQQ